jgi:hypothetical protein
MRPGIGGSLGLSAFSRAQIRTVTDRGTLDAGRMAAAAGVGTLVLTHLVPGEITENSDDLFIEGASRHFEGEIIVGRDLMVI